MEDRKRAFRTKVVEGQRFCDFKIFLRRSSGFFIPDEVSVESRLVQRCRMKSDNQGKEDQRQQRKVHFVVSSFRGWI